MIDRTDNPQSDRPDQPDQPVVVVTGASGVVGRSLLAELAAGGRYELRVLAREPDQFAPTASSALKVGGYDDMQEILTGADAVIHLAARNNDQGGTNADFDRDNTDLAVRVAETAAGVGVTRFVFATTTKALAGRAADAYGASKARAEHELLTRLADSPLHVSLVRFGPIHGRGARGKVRFLESVPDGLRSVTAGLLRSILPIVSAENAAKGLAAMVEDESGRVELCVSDPLAKWSPYWVFSFVANGLFVVAVPTILAAPMVGAAAAVALGSRGGVFFVQDRVGYRQQTFPCRKFRTMRAGTPVMGTHQVAKGYVTRVGAVLRRFKLDELPQAINVARREMNVVGPRPCLEKQEELIAERARYGVFDVRPGITGLAQVAGVDMSEPHRLAVFDHRYAAFRSIAWDVTIALRTVLGGGFGDPVGGTEEPVGTAST